MSRELPPEVFEAVADFPADDQAFMARIQHSVDILCNGIADRRDQLRSHCQSPIERKMADMLVTCPLLNSILRGPTIWKPGQGHPREIHKQFNGGYICPQLQIGPYRVDFAVLMIFTTGEVRLVVECDGHDFHEKTKEQAARDKERDRYLTEQGYRVIRFSGSEIWRDAIKCGDQVTTILMNDCVNGQHLHFKEGAMS